MMKVFNLLFRILFSIVFVFSCSHQYLYAQENDSTNVCCKYIRITKETTLDSLGFHFKNLRPYKGNKCCEDNSGSFSRIIHAIADSINELSKPENYMNVNRLHELLGIEDKRFCYPEEKPTYYHGIYDYSKSVNEEFEELHYYWRGIHDYLIFFIKNEKVMFCRWIYKLE